MTSYTRQSSFSDGDTITAALFNNEYNQILNAFAYATSGTTGHQHDGTAGEGGNIHTIGDQDFLNKIVVDSTNNRWGVFVQVSSSAVEQIRIQDGAIVPVTDNDIDLGTSSLEFKDGYFDGTVYADAINFNGTAITATAAELNIMDGVTSTAAELNILDGVTASAADINLIDGITNGTVIASKAIITDSNKDISGGRNITISGELDAATLDISGDADIDGTANLDAVDIDGTVQIDGVTTFGVDDTGVDVKFFGATSGAYLLWDESADKLLTAGATTIDIVKDKLLIGSTAVTTTAAELNILDGVTSTTAELNILDGVTSTAAELNILDGVTSTAAELNILDGVTSTAAELNILDGVTTTAAEINLIDGDTSRGTTAVASGDGILINDAGTMRMTNVDTVSTYFSSHNVGGGNIVTTGALNSGSITSGFGAIDNGSSNISTTGTITFGSITDGTITATAFVDEDDMSSDSATLIPTQQSVKAYVDGQDFAATSFVMEDGDGTEVTITKNKEMKFIGDGITINWTDTDNGTDGDPYDLTFTIDAAQSNITSLGTLTALTVDNVVINGATIGHGDDTDLMTVADGVLTVAGEVSMTTLDIGGTNVTSTAAELNILDGVTSTAAELNILDGVTTTAAEINLIDGDTARGTTAVASGDGILINDAGTMRMTNVDTVSTYFASHSVGGGNIVTTGALNSGSITSGFGAINNGSSAITTTGTVSFGSISDGTITVTAFVDEDNMASDSATLIPTQQSVKAYVDASGGSVDAAQTGITSIKNTSLVVGRDDDNLIKFGTDNQIIFEVSGGDNVIFKASGEIEASSLDISGDVDVDGTLETDAFSIAGTAVTSTAAELNILDGVTSTAAELNILDGVTSTAAELNILDGVTSTAAELNILDGVTSTATELNLLDGSSPGSVVNSKAVIYSSGGVVNATDVAVSGSGNRSISITSSNGIASMEIGAAASNAAFIDLKTPSSDDFDVRLSSSGDGSGGFVQVASGNFNITGSGKTSAVFDGDGAVTLYHNNAAKLATASGGVTVTGTLTATTLSGAISGNISQLTNNSGYVTSSGVTSVATGNGLTGGTITGTGTLSMSGSYSGNFSATGNITAYSSDSRLKDFKGKIDNPLDKIEKLNGYYYEWNDTAKSIDSDVFKEGLEVGVNAQEVEAVLPEVITEAPIVKTHKLDTDYKTVYYDKIVPLLIEGIKELKKEIEELKSKGSA